MCLLYSPQMLSQTYQRIKIAEHRAASESSGQHAREIITTEYNVLTAVTLVILGQCGVMAVYNIIIVNQSAN